MNRQEIRDEIRTLADELTEAPEGLFTDAQLNSFINRSLSRIQMELLQFVPWYFRKEKDINLVINQREYNIRTDIGIDGYIVITSLNQKLDFDEGGGELTATITTGTYTPTTLCSEIKTRLDAAGGTYSVIYSGKVFRISKTDAGTLSLLCNTGTNVANGIWETIGFSTAADKTGFLSYAGDYSIDVQAFLKFEAILNRESGGKSVPLIYLDPKDLFLHETVDQTDSPANVKYWGYKDLDEIFILPIPNANATAQLKSYYFWKIPNLSADSDSPELHDSAHDLVIYDVLRKWYVRDGGKGAGEINTMYTELMTLVQYNLSAPQGHRPGKRPGVPEIAKATPRI